MYQKQLYNTDSEEFALQMPTVINAQQCTRALVRTVSQSARFFDKSDYINSRPYLQSIAHEKYMKVTCQEDQESLL